MDLFGGRAKCNVDLLDPTCLLATLLTLLLTALLFTSPFSNTLTGVELPPNKALLISSKLLSEDTMASSFQDLLYAGGGEWMWEHVRLQAPLTTIAQRPMGRMTPPLACGQAVPVGSSFARALTAPWSLGHSLKITLRRPALTAENCSDWWLFILFRSSNQALVPPAGPDLRQDLL